MSVAAICAAACTADFPFRSYCNVILDEGGNRMTKFSFSPEIIGDFSSFFVH